MYILNYMNSHDKNKYSFFDNWLKINLFLVFSIIIVGGLTRLTDRVYQ